MSRLSLLLLLRVAPVENGCLAFTRKSAAFWLLRCARSHVDTYRGMLTEDRKAHRENHRALSAIAVQIMATKNYEDYKKLKNVENRTLFAIETQKVKDANDVAELRLRISERDAEMLEVWQRDQ